MEDDAIIRLQDALFRERVERSRRMSSAQKLRAGAELFEEACQWTLGGIRHQHPAWDEGAVQAELRRRLRLADQLALRA